jgi:hypothetical protein
MQSPDPNYIAYSDNKELMQTYTKWKDHPDFLITQDNFPDIDEYIYHPHFDNIHLLTA